jgi:hypothetical protein
VQLFLYYFHIKFEFLGFLACFWIIDLLSQLFGPVLFSRFISLIGILLEGIL